MREHAGDSLSWLAKRHELLAIPAARKALMRDHSHRRIFHCGPLEIDLARRELRSGGVAAPIGSRAFAIVEILVQSAGEVVDKRDLLRRVWPGMVVEENTLHAQISAVRKALGLEYDLLKTAPGRGYQLLGAWEERRPTPEKLGPSRDAPRHSQGVSTNLPVVAQMLVGRAAALQQLRDYIALHRIVTLTGPGGIGKTSLAREVARLSLADFSGDVHFVELAAVSDQNLVPPAVATALGLRIGADEISSEAVAASIDRRGVLIVLDNCEHVVESVAALADIVTRACPFVTILTTSRELLRIDGEYVYRVEALDVPRDDLTSDAILQHSAVQLFVARTKALLSDFTPRDENLPTIVSICRRLDGIPLAIEFAAARVATLGLHQVAARLDDRFALLTSGRRTALDRHQTLRATLDWSYRLLTESEKRLFHCLSVFSGGFTLEAAAAVMNDPQDGSGIALDDISNLISKSFVALDSLAFGNRWRLIETIRAYALEKLIESGESERAFRRHAEFFQNLMAGSDLGTRIGPITKDIARFAGEIDNVRAALDWSFSPAGDVAIGVKLTAAYAPVWLHSAQLYECRERIERSLNAVDVEEGLDRVVRLRLYHALAYSMLYTMGDIERTRSVLTAALGFAEELDDWDAQMSILGALTALYYLNGEARNAYGTADRFLALERGTGDPVATRIGERLAGNALQFWGRQMEAQARLENAIRLSALRDSRHWIEKFRFDQHVLARSMLARVLWLRGAVTQAVACAELSLRESRAANDQLSLCWVLYYGVFPVSIMTEDFATADQAVSMLLDPAFGIPTGTWRVVSLLLRGKLLVARGEGERGVALLKSGIDASERSGWKVSYPEFLCSLAQGLQSIGQHHEAIAAIDQGISLASDDREQWYQPELFRTKGELLRGQSGDEPMRVAADCFNEAIDLARKQGALSWELRAAHSLACLKKASGKEACARRILEPVYLRFTEGFDTPDLMSAKATLESLVSGESAGSGI